MNALCRSVIRILLPFISVATVPNTFGHVFVWHFVENAVACYQYEIMVFVNLKLSDVWFSFDDVDVATSISELSFRVAKGSGDGQPSRQDSNWSNDIFWLGGFGSGGFLWILWVILNRLGRCGLIHLSTTFDDSIIFVNIRWFMVPA